LDPEYFEQGTPAVMKENIVGFTFYKWRRMHLPLQICKLLTVRRLMITGFTPASISRANSSSVLQPKLYSGAFFNTSNAYKI
jgi:hypothetical protein